MRHHIVDETLQTLLQGGVVIYPTDTIWGIGCDARSHEAVEHLFAIKQRDVSKSMLILCTDSLMDVNVWSPPISDYPTTYILPCEIWEDALKTPIADNLIAQDGSLGVRVITHGFCKTLLDRLKAPIVSTSANFSGKPAPLTYEDINADLMQCVDYCVPPLPEWDTGRRRSSRIVKITRDGATLTLRE